MAKAKSKASAAEAPEDEAPDDDAEDTTEEPVEEAPVVETFSVNDLVINGGNILGTDDPSWFIRGALGYYGYKSKDTLTIDHFKKLVADYKEVAI